MELPSSGSAFILKRRRKGRDLPREGGAHAISKTFLSSRCAGGLDDLYFYRTTPSTPLVFPLYYPIYTFYTYINKLHDNKRHIYNNNYDGDYDNHVYLVCCLPSSSSSVSVVALLLVVLLLLTATKILLLLSTRTKPGHKEGRKETESPFTLARTAGIEKSSLRIHTNRTGRHAYPVLFGGGLSCTMTNRGVNLDEKPVVVRFVTIFGQVGRIG
jgi:hypothetical protein